MYQAGLELDTVATSLARQKYHIDGLVQEKRNSSALAMELHLSRTNPST